MRDKVSNLNENEIYNDSGNLKGKCVETRTTLISDRYAQVRACIDIIGISKVRSFFWWMKNENQNYKKQLGIPLNRNKKRYGEFREFTAELYGIRISQISFLKADILEKPKVRAECRNGKC